jgi:hypothetical protein
MESDYSKIASEPGKTLNTYSEDSYIDYKWEELIVKMCSSDNSELREAGIKEYKATKLKSSNFLSSYVDRLKLDCAE